MADGPNARRVVQQVSEIVASAQEDRESSRLPEALAGFREAERLCQEHELLIGRMAAAVAQGEAVVLLDQGHADRALEACGRAVGRLGVPGGQFDDESTRAGVLSTTGMCLRTLGEYGRADEAYRMAITHAQKNPDELLATVLNSYGALWSALEDSDQARAYYEDALRVLDEHAPESTHRASILLNLGGALQDAGEIVPAVSALEEALTAAERGGSRRGQAQALLALSNCHQKAEDVVEARRLAERACEIAAQDAPASEMHARCLRRLSQLAGAEGDVTQALEVSQEAAEILTRIAPDTRDAIDGGCWLAALQLRIGEIDQGIDTTRAVLESAERLRAQAPGGATRQTITAISSRAADLHAAALMMRANDGEDARAFVDTLERRQARHLVDELGSGSLAELPADVVQEIRGLREARREPGRQLQHAHWALQAIERGEAAPVSIDEVRRAKAGAKHTLHLLDAAIDKRLPLAGPVYTLPAEEIRARLTPGQCLIHCLASPMGTAVATMTRAHLRIQLVADRLEALEAGVAQVVKGIRSRDPRNQETLRGFSNMLLTHLPEEAEEVIIVPDGPLHRLPWAILPDPHEDGAIGIRRRISHAASATAWVAASERIMPPAADELLLVGDPAYTNEQFPGAIDPRLSGTVRELEEIEREVQGESTVLVRDQATEAAVMADLSSHRRGHIACHGLVDSEDARYSGLILAPPTDAETRDGHDDLLQAWEIAELTLPCETVVLSACSTAVGDLVPGDGVVGIVRALQLAGARQVLAPLWPISDQVAPDLLVSLYKHLEAGHPLDDAVRRTRYDFRNADPAHWACWAVYGPGSRT